MSSNPFALLNDSDDDDEAAPQQTTTKPAAKPESKKSNDSKAAPKKPQAKSDTGKDTETPSYGAGERGGRGGAGGRGDRGGRGSRPPREGKREFDRHSGTGRPPTEMKKGGAGKGNWGTEGDQGDVGDSTEPGEETEEMKQRREEREKEEKQITFEEYQAKIAGSKGSLAAKAVIKGDDIAGEVITKPDDDVAFVKTKGYKNKAKKDSNAVDKSLLGFQAPAHEVDTGKGGKGYGGRGGGKGKKGGGRGKSSGPEMTVDFKDTNAFPDLG